MNEDRIQLTRESIRRAAKAVVYGGAADLECVELAFEGMLQNGLVEPREDRYLREPEEVELDGELVWTWSVKTRPELFPLQAGIDLLVVGGRTRHFTLKERIKFWGGLAD